MKSFISDILNRVMGYKQYFMTAQIFIDNDGNLEWSNLSQIFITRRLYYPDIKMSIESFKEIIKEKNSDIEIHSIDIICIHRINGTEKYNNVDKSTWEE